MELSNSLIKRFTEATRDKSDVTAKTEAYGTVQSDGSVVLDGASSPTPCSNTVSMNPGDRVIVKIVNHQAVVTGNLTSEALDATATDERIDSKMEDVIEVVDEQGTRIVQVESAIEQANDEILLKVDQTEFDEEMRKVGEKTASLDVTVGLIEGKVSETEWYTVGEDNLQDSSGNTILDSSGGNTVGITKITKESAIRQNADEIQLRVTNTAFNALGERVSSAESTITQQANQIASKVSQTDFNALGQRVSSAESTITQQANQIASKVSQTDFNALGQRVSSAESTITQHANQISTKVSAGDIASTINQTAQSVKISADRISFEGLVTANNYFKILADGSVEANKITIQDKFKMRAANGSIVSPFSIDDAAGSVLSVNIPIYSMKYLDMWNDILLGYNGITIAGNEIVVNNKTERVYGFNMDSNSNLLLGVKGTHVSESSGTFVRGGTVRIYSHSGGVYLGSSGSTAITSDEELKDITNIDERYEEFFMRLRPILYKYKRIGHRTHIGFGARAVEYALTESGLTTEEFAGILIDRNVTISADEAQAEEDQHYSELYSLRYEEFGPLCIYMLQKAFDKIDRLENELTSYRL